MLFSLPLHVLVSRLFMDDLVLWHRGAWHTLWRLSPTQTYSARNRPTRLYGDLSRIHCRLALEWQAWFSEQSRQEGSRRLPCSWTRLVRPPNEPYSTLNMLICRRTDLPQALSPEPTLLYLAFYDCQLGIIPSSSPAVVRGNIPRVVLKVHIC